MEILNASLEGTIMNTPVTIIMIEDDEGHARLIERNIRRSGINNEIVPFSSGKPALDYFTGGDGKSGLEKGKGYLVLLDLNLPDMSGVDILKKLKDTKTTERISIATFLQPSDEPIDILGGGVDVTRRPHRGRHTEPLQGWQRREIARAHCNSQPVE